MSPEFPSFKWKASKNDQWAEDLVKITIQAVNDLPVIDSFSKNGSEDGVLLFRASDFTQVFSDIDHDLLSDVIIQSGPENGALFVGGETVKAPVTVPMSQLDDLTYIPDNNFFGMDHILWNAFDGQACAHESSGITITISPINDSPAIVSQQSISINEDESYTLTLTDLTIVDPDSEDTGEFTLTISPGNNFMINGFEIIPTANFYGQLILPVLVCDGTDNSPVFNLTVTVLPVNDRPVISAIDDITILEDTAAGPLSFNVSDIETISNQLIITSESANPGIISPPHILIDGNNDTRTLTVTPLMHQSGSSRITISVADGTGLTASESFMLSVVAVADPPVLDVNPIASTFENMPLSLTILPPTLMDRDGSESLSLITLSGMPRDMTLSSGILNANGSWTLSADQLSGLYLMPSRGYVGSFSITVNVSAIENSNQDQANTWKTISAYVHEAQNNYIPTDITAQWENNYIHLNWATSDVYATLIYRGTSDNNIEQITQTQNQAYTDVSVDYFQDYYYQLASVKECADPVTNRKIYITGPLSEIISISGKQPPILSLMDASLQPDGSYIKRSSISDNTVSGTYDYFSQPPVITASSEMQTITATISEGSFDVILPSSGSWTITAKGPNPREHISVNITVQNDPIPGELVVETNNNESFTDDTISITGNIGHTQFESFAVSVVSDRFPEQSFDMDIQPTGSFTGDIPLMQGNNQLTVISNDGSGNTSEKVIHIFRELSDILEITILSPKSGSIVSEPYIDLTGTVYSTLPAEEIQIILNDIITFSSGSESQYTFTFNHIQLQEGLQTLLIVAKTMSHQITEQVMVGYNVQHNPSLENPPEIEIFSPKQRDYIHTEQVDVSGVATSEAGIASVRVNGQLIESTGGATQVSFHTLVDCTGETHIVILATDSNGLTSSVQSIVYQDQTAPLITVFNVTYSPGINAVKQNPYPLSGMVTEPWLAGLVLNDAEILTLTPGDQEDTWIFQTQIPLDPPNSTQVRLDAWDRSGNQDHRIIALQLDTTVTIDILSPQNEQEIIVTDNPYLLPVNIRTSGMNSSDSVQIVLDSNSAQLLDINGSTATGTIALSTSTDSHELVAMIIDNNQTVKLTAHARFWVTHYDDQPLSILNLEPENGGSGIAPNAPIEIFLNRSIDPSKITATVLQTVHGMAYQLPEKGAKLSQLSKILMEEIHKDREPIALNLFYLPEKNMIGIHPTKDMAYGAQIYLSLRYDDVEIVNSEFHIRPLPTFIKGNVTDQEMNPLKGLSIHLSTMDRDTETDENGFYAFGFGDTADQRIPAGRYKITINPGQKSSSYGTTSLWITTQEGRLNDASTTILPYLTPRPSVPITSGQIAILDDSHLILDLRSADIIFPDGRQSGMVHVQFLAYGQYQYQITQPFAPYWMYALHPSDISVMGDIQLTITTPMLQDSYDYLSAIGEYVLLIGLDPDSLMLKPVGAGKVNSEERKIESIGKVYLRRLDYLGYAFVGDIRSTDFERYKQNELSIDDLIRLLNE